MNTIMIIEDNEAEQFLWKKLITAVLPDIEILSAKDGEDGLKKIQEVEDDPDLILLDINMPKMDGHQFLEVFSDNNTKEIPVVVMLTSSNLPQDREQALSYRCVRDYLLKPIGVENIEKLEELVLSAHNG